MPWPASAELLAPLAPWFQETGRSLPWRADNLHEPHPDPYAVLVSELMLQQTQVATVIPFFQRWMARFPDAATLADATEDEIHKLWEGLGYYRRARLLQAAARRVRETGWPGSLEGLLRLPGLGPYTAAAVASIAFQWPAAALDGNAFRVLARLLGIETDPRERAPRLREWLEPALRAHGPSRLTQAIMELGATVCTPVPRCAACPLAAACQARLRGLTERIPARSPRQVPRDVELWLLAVHSEGRWLLQAPGKSGLLAGLWRWPALPWEEASERVAEHPAPFGVTEVRTWPGWTQVYSHRREHVRPVALECAAPFPAYEGMAWIDEDALAALPLGRRDQRFQALLLTPSAMLDEAPPVAGLLGMLQGPHPNSQSEGGNATETRKR